MCTALTVDCCIVEHQFLSSFVYRLHGMLRVSCCLINCFGLQRSGMSFGALCHKFFLCSALEKAISTVRKSAFAGVCLTLNMGSYPSL